MTARGRTTRSARSTRATGVLALAAVTAALITGCGSSETPIVGAAGAATPGTHLPARTGGSGTVNWEWKLPTSWDPVTSTAGWDVHVLSLVYASITRLTPDGAAGPGLARSWRYSDGGRRVTFTLRRGLRFQDGTRLDAQAVKLNLERGLHQADSTVASELAVIRRVVVDSPTRFTLDLDEVDYQVPALLGGKTGMIVSPEALRHPAQIPTRPDGAGPFALTAYVPDSHADLVRNPGYWDARDIHLAHLTVQDITDPQQILAALESGQINVAYIPGDLVASARRAGFRILDIPSEVVTELDTQTTTRPFTDPRIVRAVNLAIDREALVKVQQAGYGAPAYQPFPRGYVGYSPRLADEYPYDPAKARALVKAAGAVARTPITLTNGLGAPDDSLAEQLQSELEAVGLHVRIEDVPSDTFTESLYVAKSIPFALDQTAGRESPIEMLDVLYDQKGLMNVDGRSARESATVADSLARTLQVPLTSRRYARSLRATVTTSVEDDPIHIWLFTTPRILAVSPKVHGIPFDLVQQRWEGVRVSR